MIVIKSAIFSFLIVSVKLMFVLFFQEEDSKLYKMKEVSDFIEFLRIYSCSMRMSLEEIISKYNFKYVSNKEIFVELLENIKNEELNEFDVNSYEKFISKKLQSPKDFNIKLIRIKDFYGTSLADVLDNKLIFLKKDIDKFIDCYENEYKERKKLLNKLSLLIGCLIAIILV